MPAQPNKTGVYGPFSAATAFTRATLPAPTDIDSTYLVDVQSLSVAFQGPAGATGFELSVRDVQGAVKLIGSAAASPISVDAHVLAADTPYTILVRATQPGVNGAWSAPVDMTIKPLTAPAITSVTNETDTVVVVFTAVPGANYYTAEILDSAGAPLVPALSALAAQSPVTVPAATLTAGQSYQAKVRADLINPAPPGI